MDLFTLSYLVPTVCGVLYVIFYLYAKYKLSYWKRQGIPSLPAHLIFGNFKDALLFRTSPGAQLGQIYKEANDDDPVVGFYILHKPFLLLRDPKVIKQILLKDFNIFPDRYFNSGKSNDMLGKLNLFSINSPEWKYLRTKLSPAFSSGKIKKFFPLMLQSAENMKNYFNNQIKDVEVKTNFEVRSVSFKYIMDIISSFAFGISTDSFQIPEPEFLVRWANSFKTSFVSAFELFAIFFFPEFQSVIKTSMLGKQTDYFRTVFWDSMNSREKSGSKRGDIIDNLLEIKNEEQKSDFKFEGDALVSQSAIFSVAGLETSATTTAFTLLELARNIEIQERVREEIKEKIKENGLTYESVQEMKYLHQTIAETLRLVPPAPILDRVALVDYKIPGTDIVIKKGTVVYTPLCGLHENPKYFPNPQSYDPDRFSDEHKKDIVPCTYMPFGDGPRICIGQRLGLLQVAVGLITILKDFEISLNPMYKNEVDPRAIFIKPTNGINLYFNRISTATLSSSSNH